MSSSSGGAYHSLWQTIWRARVPPKVKVCGWHICCDILPTRSNLNKKGVRVAESCSCYDKAHKTDSHALRDCSFSRAVWAAALMGVGEVLQYHDSVKEWLTRVLEETQVEFDTFLMLMWTLRTNRNNLVYEGQLTDTTIWCSKHLRCFRNSISPICNRSIQRFLNSNVG